MCPLGRWRQQAGVVKRGAVSARLELLAQAGDVGVARLQLGSQVRQAVLQHKAHLPAARHRGRLMVGEVPYSWK